MFLEDRLARDLYFEICKIPLIDPHSHIHALSPASRTLDDILGYHYYTELAHSAGMDQGPLAKEVSPRERVAAILQHLDKIDNTAQYSWFVEIARTFLGFTGERILADQASTLFDQAVKAMSQPDWEKKVLKTTNVDKIFLTNDFDDPLEGFDTTKYIPCLRTDDIVFALEKPEVRARLRNATGIEVVDSASLRDATASLFQKFVAKGAKACAISLPPEFTPQVVVEGLMKYTFGRILGGNVDNEVRSLAAMGSFWMLAEHCRDFGLPFDLMIGVNRRVYKNGVFQGQDLFDQRTSLHQYARLFNAFPTVTFPVSVLTSNQNQELMAYSWIFPNVVTNGHWWYSNIPPYIANDAKARLAAVPKTKQIGYYSDAYKLEFILPKYNMYRRILAKALADDFVRPGIYKESEAIALAKMLLRDNVERIFGV